jgi:hypothetical protein
MLSASALAAISGMLAAAPAAPRAGTAALATVEIAFSTNAGEGAGGRKRFTRDGCYQVESGGSTGGAGYARDSQAGCHQRADAARIFARLDAIGADGLAREGATGGDGDAARRGPVRGLMPGGSETRVILIRSDGSRWVAANETAGDDILRAINDLPSEDQSYAKTPEPAVGVGPQLVVLSATSRRSGAARVQASLASDGRWRCYRTTIGARGGEPKLPAKKPQPVTDAAARLRRILTGVSPKARDDAPEGPVKRSDGAEIAVEVAWPGQARAPLRPARAADAVLQRFGAEMQPLSPACAIP